MYKSMIVIVGILLVSALSGPGTAYESNCVISEKGSSEKVTLFLDETSALLIQKGKDPFRMQLNQEDGTQRSSIKTGDFVVDFSNRADIKGYLIKEEIVRDTVVIIAKETKKETIKVIESTVIDTLNTCKFIKIEK